MATFQKRRKGKREAKLKKRKQIEAGRIASTIFQNMYNLGVTFENSYNGEKMKNKTCNKLKRSDGYE